MESQLKHKVFDRQRGIYELLHTCNLWASEFEFIKTEISFLSQLITTFPFKSSIPNLFENIQLFKTDLEELETTRKTILLTINSHNQQLKTKIKLKKLSYDTTYIANYDEMAEKVLTYLEKYKNLKIKIYQYLRGLLS